MEHFIARVFDIAQARTASTTPPQPPSAVIPSAAIPCRAIPSQLPTSLSRAPHLSIPSQLPTSLSRAPH
eukprot:6705600-Prymnesium_polylepis.1